MARAITNISSSNSCYVNSNSGCNLARGLSWLPWVLIIRVSKCHGYTDVWHADWKSHIFHPIFIFVGIFISFLGALFCVLALFLAQSFWNWNCYCTKTKTFLRTGFEGLVSTYPQHFILFRQQISSKLLYLIWIPLHFLFTHSNTSSANLDNVFYCDRK